MRTRTLEEWEALKLFRDNAFTSDHQLAINGKRHPISLDGNCYPMTSVHHGAHVYPDNTSMTLMIHLGATIEVTEHDVFDDQAFEKWDVDECRLKADRGNFSVWSNGMCYFYAMLVTEVNPSDIPALAAAVNRLVEVGEVEG